MTLRFPLRRGSERGRLRRERKLGRDDEDADGVGEEDCLGGAVESGATVEEDATEAASVVTAEGAVVVLLETDADLLDRWPIPAFGADGMRAGSR